MKTTDRTAIRPRWPIFALALAAVGRGNWPAVAMLATLLLLPELARLLRRLGRIDARGLRLRFDPEPPGPPPPPRADGPTI